MDAVELPLPAAIVTKLMRSSGCGGGGGVTRVELVASQLEGETSNSSFHPRRDNNCNVNGSKPNFWNKMSDTDLFRQASQSSSLGNEEAFIDHDMANMQSSFDMASMPDAKQQRKSKKAARSNENSSRRSRAVQTSNETGSVVMNGLPKELGSYPRKANISEKMQTAKLNSNVSAKRSDKRNGKVPKSKCDSYSVKAGLSSFSSAAAGNNLFGVYGTKQDTWDLAKNVDELSLNELLDGSYKQPQSVKDKGKKTANLNENILHSVKEACSILQLQKPTQSQNMEIVDNTYHHNALSCSSNPGTFGASRSDDNKGDIVDPSSCNKVEDSCSGLIDYANILEFPLFAPKDVFDRLALPPPKNLDLLLLDGVKPTSSSKGNLDPRLGKPVQSRNGLPTFPWSHISGGHYKTNPDAVKSTPSKSTCQGRWVKMGNSTTSVGDTAFLKDFESLTYDQSLVPFKSQQPESTEKGKSQLPFVSDMASERVTTPSGTHTMSSKIPDEHTPGALAAAQTLCDIAARYRKQDQNGTIKSKKSSQKSTKLQSDEKLEKALFAIPNSISVGPTIHTSKKLRLSVNEKNNDLSNPNSLTTESQLHWSTTTPQSSRSSPCKPYKDVFTEAKSSSRFLNKPSKLRKLGPMEWKSQTDKKSN